MYRSLWLWILIFFAACSSPPSQSPDASIILIDSHVDDAPPVWGPNTVTVQTYGIPLFIRFRDGNGAWQAAKDTGGTSYELGVTTDYEAVVVCGNVSGTDATLFKRTFGDGSRFSAYCFDGGPEPGIITVDGSLMQPGQVFMQDDATGTTSPWSFSLKVSPGMHDFVAVAGHRIEIRRNLQVTTAMNLGTLNLLQTGTAMTPKPLTINADGDETVTNSYSLLMDNDYVFIDTPGSTTYVPPDAMIEPTDLQFLDVFATTDTTYRIASTIFTGPQTTFQLMPKLTGIAFTTTGSALTASWGTLPTYETVAVTAQSYVGGLLRNESVRATKGWITAKNVSQLTWDTTPSGYDSTWHVNLAGPHSRSFSAQDPGQITYATAVYEQH